MRHDDIGCRAAQKALAELVACHRIAMRIEAGSATPDERSYYAVHSVLMWDVAGFVSDALAREDESGPGCPSGALQHPTLAPPA